MRWTLFDCRLTGGLALVSLLAPTLALAMPLGSPVADAEFGHARVSGSVGAQGTIQDLAGLPMRTLRLDVLPFQHFGVFGDAAWITSPSTIVQDGRDRAWQLGGGMRGDLWFTRVFAFSAAGRASYGHGWTVVPGGDREERNRELEVIASPALVLGAEGGGLYAWAGPSYALRGGRTVAAGAGGWDWTDAGGRLGVEIGGEAHSSDLLSQGLARALYASTGFTVHLRDRFGLHLWVGFGW